MWRKYAKIVIFVFLEQRCSNCVLKLRFVHFYKMHINREQVRCAKIISACVNARHMDTRHVFLIWHILMTLYFGDTDLVDNELCWQKMHLKDTSNYAVNLKFHYCAWQTRQILIISRAAIRWSFVHQSTANTFQISKQFNQSFLRPFWNFCLFSVSIHLNRMVEKYGPKYGPNMVQWTVFDLIFHLILPSERITQNCI